MRAEVSGLVIAIIVIFITMFILVAIAVSALVVARDMQIIGLKNL